MNAARALALTLLAACFLQQGIAQIGAYTIIPNITSLPAGSVGLPIHAVVQGLPQGSAFNLCFYTGFGSSTPIVPDSILYQSDTASVSLQLPTSTIQSVPPSSFSSGVFNALLYVVDLTATSCTGSAQTQGHATSIALRYPQLNSISLTSTPHLNPKLTSLLPSNITLSGMNFLPNPAPSAVLFNSTNSIAGTVRAISSTTLVSTIPTTLPLNVSSVVVQVCNTATYSYCSATKKLSLTNVPSSLGTVTATPSTALPSAPITVSASFGPVKPSIAGAPGGIVAFHYASTQLGSAQLILDKTGVFAPAAATAFASTKPLSDPVVADFNSDGIPDLLFAESGSSTLHLLLGTTPTGSFATDRSIPIVVDGSPLIVLSTAVADINRDGFPDILLLAHPSTSSTSAIYTLLNDGSGGFALPTLAFSPVYGSSILAGDFNHDGETDILVAGALADSTGLQLLSGDGTGAFIAGPTSSGLNTAPNSAFGGYKILAADLNGDGAPDIAVLNGGSADGTQIAKSIAIFENDGHGTFSLASTIPTDATNTTTFFVAPIASLHAPSIVQSSPANASLTVSLNQSASHIAFSSTPLSASVPALKQAIVGDFNADGMLDAIVDDGTTIHLLDGDGTGSFFSNYPGLTVPSLPGASLLASDENADTYPDLISLTASDPSSTGSIPYSLRSFITAGTATATLPPARFPVGIHVIQARTPGTYNIECGSVSTTLTIAKATPTLLWPAPASIVAGTALSTSQLDATASGLDGSPLEGTFKYTPALGTLLPAGSQILTVLFTPANSDYSPISASVSINVVPFTLSSLSATSATLGDPARTITLTGTGWLATSVVQMDGSPVATTYVNSTTLTAVIPATDFLTVHTIEVAVNDPSLNMTTAALGIAVTAPAAAVDFSGPTTITPGSQIALNFKLNAAYPVDITATFIITFAPAAGLPNDPSVQFAAGGRKYVVIVPAGTTILAPILIQSGTVAGVLTVATSLKAGGIDITPASVKPLAIQAILAVPGVTSLTFSGNGNMLTVTVRGYSNTREISSAKFHFKPVPGSSIKTQDVLIDAAALYAAWYQSDNSLQYGSTCTYTQVFNLSTDASVVGQVSIILTNTQGASTEADTQ